MARGKNMFGKNPWFCMIFGHSLVLRDNRTLCEMCEVPYMGEKYMGEKE